MPRAPLSPLFRCRCALPGLSLGGLVLGTDLPHYAVGTASTGRGGGGGEKGGGERGGERGRETAGSRHKALIVELSKQTCV